MMVALRTLPRRLAAILIRGYQLVISPALPAACRFTPTCSQYALDAVRKHGLVVGSLKACWRILRCNPWSHGGVDYA